MLLSVFEIVSICDTSSPSENWSYFRKITEERNKIIKKWLWKSFAMCVFFFRFTFNLLMKYGFYHATL